MDKENGKATIRAAWITGILGLFGVACTAGIALIIAYYQFVVAPNKQDVNVNVGITQQAPFTNPTVVVAVTNILPTKVENLLTITNLLDIPVCTIQISSANTDEWGDNWLVEGFPLGENRSITFNFTTGYYDGRALDCEGNLIEEWYDSQLEGVMTWDIDGK